MKIYNMTVFRILLLIWILAANLILQLANIEFGWVIFISNIMFFTMEGDWKKRFLHVEIGGLVGLILAFLTVLVMLKLSVSIGPIESVMLPLAVVLFVIIVLNPICPMFFNNISFAYFTCAFINVEFFIANFIAIMLVYLLGSIIVNMGCIILLKNVTQ